MEDNQLLAVLARELDIPVSPGNTDTVNREQVARTINDLIQHDFQRLVTLLYRVDVSEQKLKRILKDNPGIDAGLLITDLLVERQAEKLRSRKENRQRDKDIDENEKW